MLRAYFRPQASGQEYVPRTGPAIIAANHLSAADEVFTPITARRQVLYFAKDEYFNLPGVRGRITAWTFRELGQVPVDRDNPRAAALSIEVGVELLAQDKALGIYPEGTRSPDGRLHKFRTGVARLALRSGAPVMPVGPDRHRPGAARGPAALAPGAGRGALRPAAGLLRPGRGRALAPASCAR